MFDDVSYKEMDNNTEVSVVDSKTDKLSDKGVSTNKFNKLVWLDEEEKPLTVEEIGQFTNTLGDTRNYKRIISWIEQAEGKPIW